MAGLAGLILSLHPGAPAVDADTYLEQAAAASPRTSTQIDELRAISLYYELYRHIGDWRKASTALARSASDVGSLLTLSNAEVLTPVFYSAD